MLEQALYLVRHFVTDEAGEANEHYMGTLGFSMFSFVVALVLFYAMQHGFVHTMTGIIGGGLGRMASATVGQ